MARTFLNIFSSFFILALLVACSPGGGPLFGPSGEGLGGGVGENPAAPSQSELGQDTAPTTPIDCPEDWKDAEGNCVEPVGGFKALGSGEGGDDEDPEGGVGGMAGPSNELAEPSENEVEGDPPFEKHDPIQKNYQQRVEEYQIIWQ